MITDGGDTPSAAARTPLTAQTLLGDNAVATLAALVTRLSASTGLGLHFDDGDGTRSSDDLGAWRHDLIWACGLITMRTLEAGDVNGDIVAAPVFAGERSAHYHAVLVARPDGGIRTTADVARCRVAINELASWSGCQGLLAHLAAAAHPADFAAVVRSGSHRRSIETVADGRADAAAIDHTIWQHLSRTEPALTRRLVVIERTLDWPAPPFVVSRALPDAVRERLIAGLVAVRPGDVAGLERVERCDAERYRALLASALAQAEITRTMRERLC